MLRPELDCLSPDVRDALRRIELLRANAAGNRRAAETCDLLADELAAQITAGEVPC